MTHGTAASMTEEVQQLQNEKGVWFTSVMKEYIWPIITRQESFKFNSLQNAIYWLVLEKTQGMARRTEWHFYDFQKDVADVLHTKPNKVYEEIAELVKRNILCFGKRGKRYILKFNHETFGRLTVIEEPTKPHLFLVPDVSTQSVLGTNSVPSRDQVSPQQGPVQSPVGTKKVSEAAPIAPTQKRKDPLKESFKESLQEGGDLSLEDTIETLSKGFPKDGERITKAYRQIRREGSYKGTEISMVGKWMIKAWKDIRNEFPEVTYYDPDKDGGEWCPPPKDFSKNCFSKLEMNA